MSLYSSARNLYRKVFPVWRISDELQDDKLILDIGCGAGSFPTLFTNQRTILGVEKFEKEAKEAHLNGYEEVVIGDVFEARKFKDFDLDSIVLSGVIEHLPKKKGEQLLDMLDWFKTKRILIVTPNGYLPQGKDFSDNPFQRHLSGWKPEELRKRGYVVTGLDGWKPLTGAYGTPRSPRWLCSILGDLTERPLRNYPESSFNLLAVKTL